MSTVSERIEQIADHLVENAQAADDLGRVPDDTAALIRDTGIVRMLQPKQFGGTEESPVDFFKGVMDIGAKSGSAGWIAGVVGIHPFEIAQASLQVQEEIWGADPDTWIASPYAPMGRAVPVEGGYRFSGRWAFSSGTDHCDWIVLGGLIADENGVPIADSPERHFILPRADYEILQDSWDVVGLKGTGSKDIVITDKFVPEHRIIDPRDLETGEAARQAGRGDSPLYAMPFHVMFGTVITAGSLALGEGALVTYLNHTRGRVTARGQNMSTDPIALNILGEAAAEISASRAHYLHDLQQMWDLAQAGTEIPLEMRAAVRRNQVRAVRRSQAAVDTLMAAAGGGAMRTGEPMQRFWRDMAIARNHAANSGAKAAIASGMVELGLPLPAGTRL